MRKNNRAKVLWVHPDFHKNLKITSAKEGTNMIELTKRLAKEAKKDENELSKYKKKP